MVENTAKAARMSAMNLLARREHTVLELSNKLRQRGYENDVITPALAKLTEDNLQSDERFTEQYIHSRRQRGYGPERIQQELIAKGVSDAIISTILDFNDPIWDEMAADVRIKKFADADADKFKIMKFLNYRGFTQGQINFAVRHSAL